MKKIMVSALCLLLLICFACTGDVPATGEPENPIVIETENTPGETPAQGEASAPNAPEPTPEPTEEPTPELIEEPTPEPTPELIEEPTPEPTPELTEEPTSEPTPESTEEPTPTPRPTPQVIYGAPQSFKPTKALKDDQLPAVYRMYEMNPKGKKEAQMFTYDLNGDGKAEKISFKVDYKKNRTTITAGKIKITLKDGAEMTKAILIDLDPTTPYTDLLIEIDTGSDDYITIPLHIEKDKFVRGETFGYMLSVGSDGALYRSEGTDLLGTQSGWRSCHGEQFIPDDEWLDVSLPTEEDLKNYKEHLGDYGWFLQLKRELPCTIDGEPATLPVGTILYMTRFHESRRLAEVRTLDGVTAMIEFTMDEDSWPYQINGISQDDYFEYELLYAD